MSDADADGRDPQRSPLARSRWARVPRIRAPLATERVAQRDRAAPRVDDLRVDLSVVSRYLYALDIEDWDLYASLFTADARIDSSQQPDLIEHGREEAEPDPSSGCSSAVVRRPTPSNR